MTRALGMALLHAAADTALAKAAVYEPTGLTTPRIIAIALLVGAAALWSAIDGMLRREDLGRTWVIASLIAGPLSGVLYVIGRSVFVDSSGTGELGTALTGGAAFTALLILVPAGLGMFVGGKLKPGGHRKRPSAPSPRPRGRSATPRA
ncbi:B-4DMT family transporter [Amycolatopsis sp. K13G38]|uniref:B-4DMT family transporter n=1 Tax=Amycolatopsis acididurans TaxID=2724524 RepID=A0ABX1J209_9PSEU|nr:B-4DMT family transporter [Amycolatopsis acididurans]